ncbi:MAG: hypothetical protein K8L91_07670 [Anaerolineae bacterium]|nr:hypothetical protein [Anaerolineae bacterium]
MSSSSKPRYDDRLPTIVNPDRLHFATGILLEAQDLEAEQLYHRGRLARALAYIHGCGTVAGLKVTYRPERPATATNSGQAEQLVVNPGLAIDRLGRLIELPSTACIRLDKWYIEQTPDGLNTAFHAEPMNGVVVDVFAQFVVCERGKTPAIEEGAFDAMDAITASRLRDGYEITLVLRPEANPPLPVATWPNLAEISEIADPAARQTAIQELHERIFDAYPRASTNPGQPEPIGEYTPAQKDKTSVFLARVVIGATPAGSPSARPIRTPAQFTTDATTQEIIPVNPSIDNHSRLFVYTTRLLAKSYGL